jgi:hypothetical protein
MPLARKTGPILVSGVLFIAAADHFLDLPLRARMIIDKHSFPWLQHPHIRFFLKHCLTATGASKGDRKNRYPKD